MRLLAFKCSISTTMTPFVDLQGQHVPLLQAGAVWSGSLPVQVTDTLNIAYTVTGITGSPWVHWYHRGLPRGGTSEDLLAQGQDPSGR